MSLTSLNTPPSSTKKHNLEALLLERNHTVSTFLSRKEFKTRRVITSGLLLFFFSPVLPQPQRKTCIILIQTH